MAEWLAVRGRRRDLTGVRDPKALRHLVVEGRGLEGRLRDLLGRQAPELAAKIDYDTESSAVWLVSEDRGALEAALALADRYATSADPT
jgi:hypothetical protein